MSMRIARGVSAAIAVGLVMAGGVAQADVSTAPAVDISWKTGKAFPGDGATRFDGENVDGKVYFLGFRKADNSTDGSIWYYDIKKKKYTDTKDDMAVPISNYTVGVAADAGWAPRTLALLVAAAFILPGGVLTLLLWPSPDEETRRQGDKETQEQALG